VTDPQSNRERIASDHSVVVLNAGVLHHFVADGLIPSLRRERAIAIRHESGPSVSLARHLRDGSKVADVFLSADAQVATVLMTRSSVSQSQWYVTFARNAVVLVYSPKSRYVSEFEKAAAGETRWFELLQRADLRLVRGDPNLGPPHLCDARLLSPTSQAMQHGA
jgi:molybdate/tungstate transport system substrate-binding protein